MAERDKHQRQSILSSVLDTIHEGVYITDLDKIIKYWNKGAEEITGYSSEEVCGSSCSFRSLEHIDDHGKSLCDTDCPLEKAMTEGILVEAEAYLHHKNGHRLPIRIRTAPVRDDKGEVIGACEVFSDISSKITLENKMKELKKLAMLDPLTMLANRRYIDLHLEKKLEDVHLTNMSVGVVFYDIDHFKSINDDYGHDVGDRVIKMVANTLIKSARGFDIVGRWGGEEFIEVIPNLTVEFLESIVERNRVLVEKSRLDINSYHIKTTISVGATIIRKDDTLKSLLKRTDQLLYKSKKEGRNRVTIG